MKITAVKTAATSGHGMHLWVRVETDEGITGTGECVHGGVQAIALIHELRPKLIGRDPFEIDAIFEDLRRRHVFDGGFAGALITALTGIEIALWDLKGKALNAPIYDLMGGKFRDKIRVYADCQVEPAWTSTRSSRWSMVCWSAASQPSRSMWIWAHTPATSGAAAACPKIPSTTPPTNGSTRAWSSWWRWSRRRPARIVAVAADVHTRLDVSSAIRLAKDLEQFHLLWLEEPVPPENIAAMREVKRATSTPICAGENLYLRHGFRDLIEQQAVDIIMPDIPKCGGLSECRKIANLAEIYYMPFAPHNVSSPIGTMASAHVCASVPNFLVLEFHWLHRDYWSTIIAEKEDIIKDGYITLSGRPGIGLELDEDVARQYQYPGTTWFE